MPSRRASQGDRDAVILEAAVGPLPPPRSAAVLVMLSGLPGSGKSHLASEICRRYPLAHLESDALRKALFKRPGYTQQESSRVFAAVHALLDSLLARGAPALLDATNLKEAHRQPVYDIAERHNAKLIIVQTIAPEAVVRRRMGARLAGANPLDRSDAGIDVYEAMRDEAEPIQREHLVVDTSGDVSSIVDMIVRELESRL